MSVIFLNLATLSVDRTTLHTPFEKETSKHHTKRFSPKNVWSFQGDPDRA